MRIEQFRQLYAPGLNAGAQERRVVDYPEGFPLPAFSAVLEDQETPLSGWAPVVIEEGGE